MKVISFKICPFVQRVTALLAAKDIPCDIQYISLKDKPQWFLDISPNAQVPLLITDNGTALFESHAIAEYLEETHPPLQPWLSAEERAIHRAWSHLGSKNYLVQCAAQRSPDAETLEQRGNSLARAFDKMEKQLSDTEFFHAQSIGMVDIAWLPLLHRADIIHRMSGHDFIATTRPKLKAWQKRLLATGLAEKSVAADFTRDFADFYLSEATLLGRYAASARSKSAQTSSPSSMPTDKRKTPSPAYSR